MEEAEKNPEAAVDAMLKANAKAGVRDTLIIGLKQTTALYHTKDTAKNRPLRVAMANVGESLDLLAQYGGLDPATRASPKTGSCSTTCPEWTERLGPSAAHARRSASRGARRRPTAPRKAMSRR